MPETRPQLQLCQPSREVAAPHPRRPSVRKYLTPDEVLRLRVSVRKSARTPYHALRDGLMITMMAAHGLRVSEMCGIERDDVLFGEGKINVRRKKNGKPSVHFVGGDELREIRRLIRESASSRFLFCGTGGDPLTRQRVYDVIRRGEPGAQLSVPVTPHTLRHSAGYRLMNRPGANLRAVQDYLGHKNIASTCIYTEMAAERFRHFETLD